MSRMTEDQIIQNFDKALETGQICVYYQLQYNHSTGRIIGAEGTVATKYLNQYLALFLWNWQHKSLSLADRTFQMKRTIMDTWLKYNPSYKNIAKRPFDINTKGQFKVTDV